MDIKGWDVGSMSPDHIESELIRLEALVSVIRGAQSRLIDEAKQRRLPHLDGARSLQDWTAARLDVARSTAGDLVRMAESDDVEDLLTAEASFDRAVMRRRLVATGASKEELNHSEGLDIEAMRRFISQRRRVKRADHRQAHSERRLVFEESFDGNTTRFWGNLPGTDGAVVRDALARVGDTFPRDTPSSRAQRNADALVALCQDDSLTPENLVAVVTVDARLATATDGEAGVSVLSGPRVGPQVIEEILCSGVVEVVGLTADGEPLGIGRKSGKIPPRLRRYVLARDGGCTVEGCTSRYRLEVHHKELYPDGPTEPENLTTLCWFHHHVVIHGRGYYIDPDSPPGRLRLLPPTQNSPPG